MTLYHLLALLLVLSVAQGKVRYNSQIATPIQELADIDGDGKDEFYTFQNSQLFVTTQEYALHGLIYLKVPNPVQRVFRGNFLGGNQNVLCAQKVNFNIWCYQSNAAKTIMLPKFDQVDFIGSTRDIIVMDVDSDGKDDLLLYTPSTGVFDVYFYSAASNKFLYMRAWRPGNLGSGTYVNWQVRAGNFQGTVPHTDVMLYNPNTYAAVVLVTVYDPINQQYYHRKWFDVANFGGPDWELHVPDLDGDQKEDCVLHSTSNGQYLTYSFASSGSLVTLPINLGTLPSTQYCNVYWGNLKNFGRPGLDGDNGRTRLRDDALGYCYNPVFRRFFYQRADATFFGGYRSYQYQWTQQPISLQTDQDGDAIKTIHELGGYDPDNNGVSDGILASYGASPFVQDIFVEVDYMMGPPGATWNFSLTPDMISLAVSTMAGKDKNLHIFQDSAIPFQQNILFNYDWTTYFDPIKNANFAVNRQPFFHYCVSANGYNGGGSSGLSRSTPGQDFIVTMGAFWGPSKNPNDYPTATAGTFLHELGHNLGMHHGGVDYDNYKPNYISIMNYLYQINGITKAGTQQWLYSDITCNNLNELALNENTGVVCQTDGIVYSTKLPNSGKFVNVNSPADFNNNNAIQAGTVQADINVDGLSNTTLIGGYNEYYSLKFNGGLIGSAAKKRGEHEERAREVFEHDDDATLDKMPPFVPVDLSRYNLKPHYGPQVLDVAERWPRQFFKSQEEARGTQPVRA